MNVPPFHDNRANITSTVCLIVCCCCMIVCVNASFMSKTINDIKDIKTKNKMIESTANNIFNYNDSIAIASRTINTREYFPTQKEAEKDSAYYRKQIKKHLKDNKEKYIKQKQSGDKIYFFVDGNAVNNDQELKNNVMAYRNAVRHLNIRRHIIRHR